MSDKDISNEYNSNTLKFLNEIVNNPVVLEAFKNDPERVFEQLGFELPESAREAFYDPEQGIDAIFKILKQDISDSIQFFIMPPPDHAE